MDHGFSRANRQSPTIIKNSWRNAEYLHFPEVLQGNKVAAEVQHEDQVQADDEDEQEVGFETSDQSEEWSSESKSPEHEDDPPAPRLQVSPDNSATSSLYASTTTWSGSQSPWLG
jgi:hypothetical protein